MFQFPRLPPARVCVLRAGAPGRGLSRLVASFVGFLCQGIHRVPLVSFAPASPAPFVLTLHIVHDAIH